MDFNVNTLLFQMATGVEALTMNMTLTFINSKKWYSSMKDLEGFLHGVLTGTPFDISESTWKF